MTRTSEARREILFQLADVARSMRTYVDQRAREHGMTRAQWGALARLERQEGMSQAEMAEALEVQPITLLRLVDRLCEQNLVERRPHPHDRRANRLYLTDKGRATLVAHGPARQGSDRRYPRFNAGTGRVGAAACRSFWSRTTSAARLRNTSA